VVLFSAVVLIVAYVLYGRPLVRLLKLDPNRKTPAWELRDETRPKASNGNHFEAKNGNSFRSSSFVGCRPYSQTSNASAAVMLFPASPYQAINC
jgi:hypothetical protein